MADAMQLKGVDLMLIKVNQVSGRAMSMFNKAFCNKIEPFIVLMSLY
jgi:hypothetical protein